MGEQGERRAFSGFERRRHPPLVLVQESPARGTPHPHAAAGRAKVSRPGQRGPFSSPSYPCATNLKTSGIGNTSRLPHRPSPGSFYPILIWKEAAGTKPELARSNQLMFIAVPSYRGASSTRGHKLHEASKPFCPLIIGEIPQRPRTVPRFETETP